MITAIGAGGYQALAVAIQADGKIIAAGFRTMSTTDFAVVRYNTDGSLDTSFNGTGKVITSVSNVWMKPVRLLFKMTEK